MHTRKRPLNDSWHLAALDHLLIRYDRHLDERRSDQILYLYQTIGSLSTTSLDYLEILRLFQKALSSQKNFKIGRHTLTTLELFYASIIVGLKLYNETYPGEIKLTEIELKLPTQSIYRHQIAYAKMLEHAFLQGMNWCVEGSLSEKSRAYIELLQGLDKRLLSQLASSFLIIASTGTGNDRLLRKVFYHINPDFREKSKQVKKGLQALPLKDYFFERNRVRNPIRNDIFNFIHGNRNHFEISQGTMAVICDTIEKYFYDNPHSIQDSERKKLAFYFTLNHINRISIINACNRIDILRLTLNPSNPFPFDILINAIKDKTIDLKWLQPLLDGIEMLRDANELTIDIFSTIFDDPSQSHSILSAYLNVHRQGWLSIINKNDELSKKVCGLIRYHHRAHNLMLEIQQQMRIHLMRNKPTLNELMDLQKTCVSELGQLLIKDLCIYHTTKLAQTAGGLLAIPELTLDTHLNRLVNYIKRTPKESTHVLIALTALNEIIQDLKAQHYLMIITAPEGLRFKARLVLVMQRCFKAYNLTCIPREMPEIFEVIINRIKSDVATLETLKLCFDKYTSKWKDNKFALNSVPGIRKHIRSVIDDAIINGKLNLSNATQYELADFYESHGFPSPDIHPSAKALPATHLFSPKHRPMAELKKQNVQAIRVTTG